MTYPLVIGHQYQILGAHPAIYVGIVGDRGETQHRFRTLNGYGGYCIGESSLEQEVTPLDPNYVPEPGKTLDGTGWANRNPSREAAS